jgi:hypothetical protein
MNKTYDETLNWLADQVWQRWTLDWVSWRGALGYETNLFAYMFDITPYDANQAIWQRVEDNYGNPLMGTGPKTVDLSV